MFSSSNNNIVVGLEVGTAKVCAVAGEYNEKGALTIIGVGQSESRGVRKGEVVDTVLAEEDIRAAIAEAEHNADIEIHNVFLGVTGKHVRGFGNRGVHTIVSADREITDEDVQDVLVNAKAINLPMGHHVLHAVRQHFLLDGQDGILNPVGMLGTRLEVEVHVIHGVTNRIQNAVRVVKGLQIEVDNLVFNGLASSLALLSPEEKEMGTVVIDLGAGTTEYVLSANGIIKHSGVLGVGGDHVTNDLAIGLKVPIVRAEQLKISHGHALADDSLRGQTFTPTSESGLPERPVNLEHLRRIMSARLEETLEIIEADLSRSGLLDYVRSGVVLSGGGARITGIQQLSERIFQMPTRIGTSQSVGGMKSLLEQPEFATCIGLVRFGAMQLQQRNGSRPRSWGLRQVFSGLIRR